MQAITLNKPLRARCRPRFTPAGIVLFFFLTIYALSMLLLMLWALTAALKDQNQFLDSPIGFPTEKWFFSNFADVFRLFECKIDLAGGGSGTVGMGMLALNSVLYAGGGALVATLGRCVTAYVVSKFDFKINKVIYAIVIVAMILPIVGSAVSELRLMRAIGLYDTIVGSYIQKAQFLGLYFLVFHDAFKGVSKEYAEAAYMDGAGEFGIFFRIMLPLVRTVFLTVFLMFFIEYWNDYQTPLLYLPSHPTIMYAVQRLSNSLTSALNTIPMRMATCMIVVLPLLAIFVIFGNKIMGDVTAGGVKE